MVRIDLEAASTAGDAIPHDVMQLDARKSIKCCSFLKANLLRRRKVGELQVKRRVRHRRRWMNEGFGRIRVMAKWPPPFKSMVILAEMSIVRFRCQIL